MFHLKKRRSEFLFFVSISLQVQHRSCNLHAVFLGLEGRGKKYFWHMILKVSTIPSCKEMHSSKILPLTLPLIFPLRLFFKKHVFFFFFKGYIVMEKIGELVCEQANSEVAGGWLGSHTMHRCPKSCTPLIGFPYEGFQPYTV